ncbi:hypothetical protein GCL60_13060 [Silvanigrella paludirubra]|uniref:Uncharacterized protein n=1 Tax=Silvanigrella paludirubra TaxID=2499159 RepID=A0A6N6VQ10_9BACT|nr:hypothetical protein [Silvanigrella paludirubra]KAB8036767.1 hypothetical protein GCL60_13060 [Silvanigrella paludirubra]
MKSLFLFFTQSEMGAPDYLSRTGEQGAETLAETIISFLSESLKIRILDNFEARAQSLNEDVLWRSFKEQSSFQKAVAASLSLYSEVLLLSGSDVRSMKTCEVLAKSLALPICVENRFDKHKKSEPQLGTLNDAMSTLFENIQEENCPKVFLIATSIESLIEWVQEKKVADYTDYFEKIIHLSSENNVIPTVFVSGLEKENNEFKWIFDLPKETN